MHSYGPGSSFLLSAPRFLDRTVTLTLSGDSTKVDQLATALADTGTKLNSWGACVKKFDEVQQGKPLAQHQVSTANVDNFKWNPNVEFYLTF